MANIYNKKILKVKLLREAASFDAAIAGGVGLESLKTLKKEGAWCI